MTATLRTLARTSSAYSARRASSARKPGKRPPAIGLARRAALAAGALLATTCLTSGLAAPAQAQGAPEPSVYKNIDAHGVDITDASFNFSLVEGAIGSGEGALVLARSYGEGGERDNLSVRFYRTESVGTAHISLVFGNSRREFSGPAGATSFTSEQGDGATLTKISASEYRYDHGDGTVTTYGPPPGLLDAENNGFCSQGAEFACSLTAIETVRPNGAKLNYNWDTGQNCELVGEDLVCAQFWRQRGVSNSFGYRISFTFVQEADPQSGLPGPDWHERASASLINDNSGGTLATVSYNDLSSTVTEVTTMGGEVWRFTKDANGYLAAIREPGSAADDIIIARDANGDVTQVTDDGVTTDYDYSVSGSTATMTVTDALNNQSVVISDLNVGRPTAATDPLGRTTSFAYDANGRLTEMTAPEGNKVKYSYDSRGNVTEQRAEAKPGSGLADIVTTASFPASCANPVTCNKPESTTDARGKTTDYSYDATHGGLLSVTLPAAPSGVRPETRYSYGQATAVAGEPVTVLTGSSVCQTHASCDGTADESEAVIVYDSVNIRPISVTRRAGDLSLVATSAMTWDDIGNLITVDGPLAGSTDTLRYHYDASRRRVGEVSPDPDGAGALKHRAVRLTFRPDGQVSKIETGTVTSQSDAAWNAFSPFETVEIGYDMNDRPVTQALKGGGTTHALTQTSHDALGRPECVAQRMNPAAWGSLPADACALGTQGSFGPDRIVKTSYDAAGQAVKLTEALGTSAEADTVTSTYTPNGLVATLKDGEDNLTTYEHDGHDRLIKTRFPVAAKGAGQSSTTDYESLTYDAGGNILTFRNRAGETISFAYDDLGRLILKDLPAGEDDVSYGYDLLGRMTSASKTGHALSFAYDALGRRTSASSPRGTVSWQHDLAGRRTRMTWPDGFNVTYDWLADGSLSAIRENGSQALASFAYDERGRRSSLTRANGTMTSYSYDAVSRLAQLVEDMGGAGEDATADFAYNPASQIISDTNSNDLYAFGGHAGKSDAYTANGLNQLTQAGAAALAWDAKGNLTSDGKRTFSYSSENLLTASGSVSLDYDPLMRLYEVADGSDTDSFLYDGLDMIGEYDAGGTLERRYVHGPGMDEPLIVYAHIGWGIYFRYFLHADERGSIVAVSDNNGGNYAINTYDSYGTPDAANEGRFQYTGQKWISDIGLYDYKTRMYAPHLGIFAQTDHIGYAGGNMNLYTYVEGDPVNYVDPKGLARVWWASRLQKLDGGGGTSFTWGHAGHSGGIGDTDMGLYGTGRLWEIEGYVDHEGKKIAGTWYYTGRYYDFGDSLIGIGYYGIASGLPFTQEEAIRSPQMACIGPLARTCISIAVKALKTLMRSKSFRVNPHIIRHMEKRGWTEKLIEDAIKNPTRVVKWRDTRHLPGGYRMNDPATAYYSRYGGYVVRNDRTGDIVQISNRYNRLWRAPWD